MVDIAGALQVTPSIFELESGEIWRKLKVTADVTDSGNHPSNDLRVRLRICGKLFNSSSSCS